MDLEYVEYPEYKKKIKKLYKEAFPKNERFPFWILKHSIKSDKSTINAIIEDNKFIGMTYIVDCDNSFYLMFFAIEKESRNKQYGSRVLKDLNEKYGTIFLSIEKPKDTTSEKSKKFYLKNGFHETNMYCSECGVDYEVLCNNKNFDITEELHKKRYSNMTSSKIVSFCINKLF